MKACFQGAPKCVEFVLRVVMGVPTLSVRKLSVSSHRESVRGHGVVFDVFAVDESGKAYDIEIQRSDHGAGCRRARFYSAALDGGLLRKGEDYDKLPESFVVFITENDVLGGNKALYHIDRRIGELGNKYFGDGAHIVYVNGKWRGKDPVGNLMRDFFRSDPGKISSPILRERAKQVKETEKGVGAMCRIFEKIANDARAEGKAEGKAEGRAEGKAEGLLEAAKGMLDAGLATFDQVAKSLKLTKVQRQALQSRVQG